MQSSPVEKVLCAMYTFQDESGSHPSVLLPVVMMLFPVTRTLFEKVG